MNYLYKYMFIDRDEDMVDLKNKIVKELIAYKKENIR